MTRNSKTAKRLLASVVVATVGYSSMASAAVAEDVVGEVTTVIGVASLRQADGDGATVKRGAPVRAGDYIETAAGGHVHIRFVDGGLVSVRPMSRLHIQEYRNETAGSKGAIKFQLEQGVVRSVTGEWGEHSRERFRLNTPVAAIGIKGTDFVVKANSLGTQASVISGAIVMSPLEGGCLGSLGPCNAEKSALLSADMAGKMLELVQSGGQVPRLVQAVDLEARLDRASMSARLAERSQGTVLASEKSGASGESGEKVALNQNLMGQLVESKLPDRATATPAVTTPNDRPLVWMRNAMEWNIPANSISQRFDEAEATSRQAVLGNFFITLYRDETTRSSFSPPASTVSFNLVDASASFSRPGIVYEPVAVSAGKLDVDFAHASYATSLALSGSFGQTQFASSGKVTSTGLMQNSPGASSMAGAFSLDSKQAAYQFEKDIAYGKVSGITLWGR